MSTVRQVMGKVLPPIHLAAEGVRFAWSSSGFVFPVLAVAHRAPRKHSKSFPVTQLVQ